VLATDMSARWATNRRSGCYRYVGPLSHKPSKRISAVTIHPWSCTHADPLGHVRGGSRCLLPICRPAGPQTVEANQRGNHPPKVLYACGSSWACVWESRCLLPICWPAGPQTVEWNQRGNHPPKVQYACGSSGACAAGRCLLPICWPAGPQTVEANQRGNHPPKVLYACGSSGACAGLRVARPAMRSSIPRSFQEPKPGARRLRSSCR
jgi:hypothetical protein